MSEREAAIVSAVTGVVIGNWTNLYKYIEELMGRPLQLSDMDGLRDTIREKAKPDFMALSVTGDV